MINFKYFTGERVKEACLYLDIILVPREGAIPSDERRKDVFL